LLHFKKVYETGRKGRGVLIRKNEKRGGIQPGTKNYQTKLIRRYHWEKLGERYLRRHPGGKETDGGTGPKRGRGEKMEVGRQEAHRRMGGGWVQGRRAVGREKGREGGGAGESGKASRNGEKRE